LAKFRKKPVVIEAEQYDGTRQCAERLGLDVLQADQGPAFVASIKTLEGRMTCAPLDWVITGVKGERYPCKPDIFEATYERVEEGVTT